MKCARPLALILLLLSLCLFIPATTWAGTEAIPAEILSDPSIDTLDRLAIVGRDSDNDRIHVWTHSRRLQ